MKFLIVFACALAAASANNFVAPIVGYPAGQHLPVIGPNGVPVDTPAVQQATAAHLTHKVEAHARNGDYAAPFVATYPYTHGVAAAAYPGYVGVPTVAAAGVPLDTPEVAAAKISHFAAHSEALARTGVAYRARRGLVYSAYSAPVVATSAYTYPYTAYSGLHYRARRGIVAPFAYSTYSAAPVVATSAYSYPYSHSTSFLYRKRRGIVAPVAYSAYSHTPYVANAAYSAYPYAHYY